MIIKVEKGIPFASNSLIGSIRNMEIGDSFFVENIGQRNNAINACNRVKRDNGFIYKSRKVENGYRIWRIE